MKIKIDSDHLIILIKIYLTWDDDKITSEFLSKRDEIMFSNLKELFEERKLAFQKQYGEAEYEEYLKAKKIFNNKYGMFLETSNVDMYYHFNLS